MQVITFWPFVTTPLCNNLIINVMHSVHQPVQEHVITFWGCITNLFCNNLLIMDQVITFHV